MNNLQIITTSDGSHSLLNTELNETYHSIHGALQESLHVFIQNGLNFFMEQKSATPIKILEVGFGTGLNALLTIQRALEIDRHMQYSTLEAFPIPKEIWSKLNYADSIGLKEYFTKLHSTAWNKEEMILPNFKFLKLHTTLQFVKFEPSSFDLVYFDAFAPNKQPEMWDILTMQKIADAMKPQGVFVTYCAKGQLKRDLKEIGLTVETLQGPPGKKEMVRAIKLSTGIS